jgi:hypothetical protein
VFLTVVNLLLFFVQHNEMHKVKPVSCVRKTVVHRFLIRGTVEERMHAAMRAGAEEWDGNKVTLRQLQELFASPPEEPSNVPESCSSTDNSVSPVENVTCIPGISSCDSHNISQNNISFSTATGESHDDSDNTGVPS